MFTSMWKYLNPHILLVGLLSGKAIWKDSWRCLKMFIIKLLYGPAILRNYIKRKLNTYVHINTCTQIFVVVFLIIAKRNRPPKYLSTDGFINRI